MASPTVPAVAGHVVRRMTLDDIDAWAAFAVLPEMQAYTSSAYRGADDLRPPIQRTLSGEPDAPMLFGLRDAATDALVGVFGFHTVSSLNRTAEITYQVRPERWGGGLATVACAAAVAWGFRDRGWVRIQATVLEGNLASRSVLQTCGFAFEGRLRNFRMVKGEPRDFLLFSTVSTPATGGGTIAP